MSSLADRLAAPPRYVPTNGGCTVGYLLRELEDDAPEDAEALRAALRNEEWRHADLVTAIKETVGRSFGQTTISRHRRKMCTCTQVGLRHGPGDPAPEAA